MSNLKDYLFYQDDWATIYCGDCLEIMPLMEPESVNLVLTDPPYNCGKDYEVCKDNLSESEYHNFMQQVSTRARIIAKNQFWVAPRYQMGFFLSLFPDAHLIVIRRGAAGPFRHGWSDQFETALAIGKPKHAPSDLWTGIRLKGEGYFFREVTFGHPGYTPMQIMTRAIRYLSIESVFDPFLGSGTTCVAAKNLNRKSIGIEINPKYCEISVKRLRQEVFDFRTEN